MFFWTLYSSTNPGKKTWSSTIVFNIYNNKFCGKSSWLRTTTLQVLLQFKGNYNALLSTEICYHHSKAYINMLI